MGSTQTKIIYGNNYRNLKNKISNKTENNFTKYNLNEYSYKPINYFSLNLNKYYKNQFPPNENDKTPFIDNLFPPNNNSIFGIKSQNNNSKKKSKYFNINPEEIIWLRPNEIFDNQPYSIFEHEIKLEDINQGKIGNCYFLSAISSLLKYPQMIYQLFKTLTIPKNNCYQIMMKINSEWKIIIIDDFFPCNKKNNFPIFCKPFKNEIWIMLLEKAWAKINKGYINIDNGYSFDVFNSLTPFSSEIIYHKNLKKENELWYLIRKNDLNNNILTCITKKDDDIENFGLVSCHSCSIIKTCEKIIKGKKIKLIQIRNPWGKKEWNGKYSNYYLEKNPDIMKYFNNEKRDNGIFWIEYNDYIVFFDKTEICKIEKCICVKNVIIEKNRVNLPNFFHLIIKKRCNVNINIIRKSYRFNKNIFKNEEIISNLILVKIDNNFKIIKTNSSIKSNCLISEILDEGEYIIYFYVDYNNGLFDKIRKFALNVSCDEYFDLFDHSIDKDFSFLFYLLEEYNNDLILTNTNNYYEDNIIKKCFSSFEETTFGFLFLKNLNDSSYKLRLKIKLTNLYIIGNSFGEQISNENNKYIEINLKKNQNFILLLNIKNFFEDAEIMIDYLSIDINKNNNIIISNNKKLINLQDIILKEIKINNYDYIYNTLNFDYTNFIIPINQEEISINTLLKKYPKEMSLLLKLPPIKDNQITIFKDKQMKGEDYYLGELHITKRKRYGRGIYYWKKENITFIGYSINGKFNGQGKFIFDDGKIYEGNFINGILKGKGRIINKNGEIKNVNFPLKEEDN